MDKFGWTPFHLAAVNGDCAILACLKEGGSQRFRVWVLDLMDLRFIDFGLGVGVWLGLNMTQGLLIVVWGLGLGYFASPKLNPFTT